MSQMTSDLQGKNYQSVLSSDDVEIAYEMYGQGQPVIFIGGILSDRSNLRAIANNLPFGFSGVTFDRRGRGDSGDAPDYAKGKEIADLRALAGLFPQPPVLFGHSSGAALALEGAASGMSVSGVVAFEPPYGFDDAGSKAQASAFAITILDHLKNDEPEKAIKEFFLGVGMPEEEAEAMSTDAHLLERADTMAYDIEIMGEAERGGVIPRDLLGSINVPVLVLAGDQSFDFFRLIAEKVAQSIPRSEFQIVRDADHRADSDNLPAIVGEFAAMVDGRG